MDQGLPGGGLLIYHVDDNVASQNDEWHPKVMLLQADGKSHLQLKRNRGDDGDPFPGRMLKTEISDDTTPSTTSYNGTRSGIRISNISNPSEVMTCQVRRNPPRAPRLGALLGDVPAARSAVGKVKELIADGIKDPVVLSPATAAVAPGHTDQLLERLIAQDVLNASLLTELLQLLRQVATAQAPGNDGGAARLNPGVNGQKGSGVNGGGVEMVH
eukprot:gene10023-10178_t